MSRNLSVQGLALALVLGLCACAPPRPTVKIALVAPFEGRLRQVGYDAFPAFRLAIREHIRAGGSARAFVSFIAYTDDGDPDKARQVARQVARDPEVLVVVGHFLTITTLAALPIYAEAGLPLIAPHVPADQLPPSPWLFRMGPSSKESPRRNVPYPCPAELRQSAFGECWNDAPPLDLLPTARAALAQFTDISLGPPPTPRSVVAWDATRLALAAIDLAAAQDTPTRAVVADALRHLQYDGLLGKIHFDEQQRWSEAPLWGWSATP